MMFLEIISPEAVLLKTGVTSVAVPGVNGEFQMLNNHAPIVSLLEKGTVKIYGNTQKVADEYEDRFATGEDGALLLNINSGTIELKDNKIVVLTD